MVGAGLGQRRAPRRARGSRESSVYAKAVSVSQAKPSRWWLPVEAARFGGVVPLGANRFLARIVSRLTRR
ncbi:hypothetical protein ACZ91_46380 [Streptomyces regensis]|nr:hypothetical protein ACZ91_46380 [Streptomyces regensis]